MKLVSLLLTDAKSICVGAGWSRHYEHECKARQQRSVCSHSSLKNAGNKYFIALVEIQQYNTSEALISQVTWL